MFLLIRLLLLTLFGQITNGSEISRETGTRRYDHIAPVLRLLHGLPPVPYTINLKILVFKSLHGKAPPYIADLIHVQESKRSL